MRPSQALVHLIRMRDMKVRRLANWRGGDPSFLRADISALNHAIYLAEVDVAARRGQDDAPVRSGT